MRATSRLLVVMMSLAIASCADQLVLKNGDKISGTIEKSDGKTIVIKTEYAGEVTVKWDAVQDVTSTQNLHVGVKGGQMLEGPVTTSGDELVVATKAGAPAEAPKESVAVIRNDAEQSAYESSLHPPFTRGWDGGINVGFALTRGNSETRNLSLAFNGVRKTLHDKTTLYANTVYATNDAPGAIPAVTANAAQGGLRYDHDFTPRMFGYGSADFQEDALQTLNLRSILGGGVGYHLIKHENTTLDLLGGINYTHESYDLLTRSFAGATFGEEFFHKTKGSTTLTQSAYVFPDLSQAGDYRATFNLGTVTKLSKWLGWQNAFGDIYVSNPPAGKRQNDILFTTGLNVAFKR